MAYSRPSESESPAIARPQEPGHSRGDVISLEAGKIERALRRACQWSLSQQQDEGYWMGELLADATTESYVILLKYFMEMGEDRKIPHYALTIRNSMLPDGGWAIYRGGPPDVSASVLSYFALRLAGISPEEPDMQRCRRTILELGGMTRARTYTKYHLALFGAYRWEHVPAVPPEMIFLPEWFPVNVYEIAAWARTIFVPLSILYALKPVVQIPPSFHLDELLLETRDKTDFSLLKPERFLSWDSFFLLVDGCFKMAERLPIHRLRRRAIQKAASWFIPRAQRPGGLGAILPAMVNSVMALKCLGYPAEHPLVRNGLWEIERLEVRNPADGSIRVQPCFSPVWDTAITAYALAQGGLAEHTALLPATQWLLARQVLKPGDWSIKNSAPPGGWTFEFDNEFYPDVDDTAMVMMALRSIWRPGHSRDVDEAVRRGLRWVLGMQNSDGGWGSFDRENHRDILTHVPFADFNAMIDPSTADIAGRVLEMLAVVAPGEFQLSHPVVGRAIAYLKREQCPDGSWYGRWGCNYVYGTWQVLRGLYKIGEDMTESYVRKAVAWLLSCQNDDGGWGEKPDSYDDPLLKGKAPSTPSQTAWALMGLLAAGESHSTPARKATEYLIGTQLPDGSWHEDEWTGTGFPKVFYLKYGLYEHNWPMMALAQVSRSLRGLEP